MRRPATRGAWLISTVLACVIVLAACGGGDDDESPTATAEPAATGTPIVEEPEAASPQAMTDASPAASPQPAEPSASPVSSGGATPQVDAQGATVVLTDYRVTGFQTTFEVGQPYLFVIENNGAETHEFVIERKGAVDEPLVSDGVRAEVLEVPPGGRATLSWTFSEPGEYQIACHRDGHYERGMVQDSIVVTP